MKLLSSTLAIVWCASLAGGLTACKTSSRSGEVKTVTTDVPNTPATQVLVSDVKLTPSIAAKLAAFGYKEGGNCMVVTKKLNADVAEVVTVSYYLKP